ncbi:MAG: hypothetical protein JNK15_14335, partial [Planctomycetes bacterium]|nr:hypothetical protein [Planctomycetota bacterium]
MIAPRTTLPLVMAALAALARAQSPDLVGTAAIQPLLAEFDAAFARGDVAALLRPFRPDHAGAHATLQLALERRCAAAVTHTRTSTIVGEPRRVGMHTVVRVRHETVLRGRGTAAPTTLHEESVLVLRPDGPGRPVPTLWVETAPGGPCLNADEFRCPVCNYAIGGVDGWLCTPLRGERANALEAATFWLLGSDVTLAISVQADPAGTPAATVASELAATLRQFEPAAKLLAVQPWLPPAHADEPPMGLLGAMQAVDLPADEQAVFHVTTFGGLQHLLLLRGHRDALQRHATAIAALLASYRLLERCDELAISHRALAHHTGGRLQQGTYDNEPHDLHLEGAPGWKAEQRTGGAAFRVVWSSPNGSRLWLLGHRVPAGVAQWSEAAADRWLAHLLQQNDLTAVGDAAAWTPAAGFGGTQRDVQATAAHAVAGASTRRWFRLLRRDDLLVVLDASPATAADE